MNKMFLSCLFAFSFTCGVPAFAMETAEITAEIKTSNFPEEDNVEIIFYSRSRRPLAVSLASGQNFCGTLRPNTYGATLFIRRGSAPRRQVDCNVKEGEFVSPVVVNVKYNYGGYTCTISRVSSM